MKIKYKEFPHLNQNIIKMKNKKMFGWGGISKRM